MTIQERINELMQDQAFADAFAAVTAPQEVVDLFGKNGIEVPMDLAEELFQPLLPDEGELSEDDLGDVAGGGSFGAAVGGAIGNGVFYGAGYLGARLAKWDKKKAKKYAASCSKFGSALGGMIGGLVSPI